MRGFLRECNGKRYETSPVAHRVGCEHGDVGGIEGRVATELDEDFVAVEVGEMHDHPGP